MVKRTNSQRGRLAQAKGKKFAYLVTDLLAEAFGVQVMLNPRQVKGPDTGRDLLAPDLPFCIQCSHGDTVDPYRKLAVARWSARDGEKPVAVLRKTNKPIIVAMYWDDWLELAKAAVESQEEP